MHADNHDVISLRVYDVDSIDNAQVGDETVAEVSEVVFFFNFYVHTITVHNSCMYIMYFIIML